MLILYQLYLNDRLIVHLFVHCVFYASVSAKVQACLEVSEGLWVGNSEITTDFNFFINRVKRKIRTEEENGKEEKRRQEREEEKKERNQTNKK